MDRINKEFSLKEYEHHNFKNFPFYWINKPDIQSLENELVTLNLVKEDHCWTVPTVCINEDNLKVKKIKNFVIFLRK